MLRHSLAALAKALLVTLVVTAAAVAPRAASAIDADRIETRRSEATRLTFHYLDRYAPAIDELDARSEKAVERLKKVLGLSSFEDVDVWVLPKVSDYFELKDEPNRAPEWAIGLSLGDKQTVIVARDTQMPGGGTSELDKTFVHELAHVAVDVARGDGEVPRWFHEGIALMIAQEWTRQRRETLSQAASTGALMSLADLEGNFPAHHKLSSLAYAESFHFVRYVAEHHGEESFAAIMERVRGGTEFPDAVRQATGRSLAALEKTWREQLTENTSWIALLRDDFTIFFAAALIFAIGWIVRQRGLASQVEEADDDSGEWSYDRSQYPLPGESDDDRRDSG